LRDGYVHAGGAHRELRSFPTRRSSDLRRALGRIPAKRDGRRDIEIGELLKDPVKAGDAVVLSDKIGLAGFLIAHAHARDMDEDGQGGAMSGWPVNFLRHATHGSPLALSGGAAQRLVNVIDDI